MGGVHYTDDDIQYIKDNLDVLSYRAIAEHLGRSENSVIKLCSRLCLKKHIRARMDFDITNTKKQFYALVERDWIVENASNYNSASELHSAFICKFGRSTEYKKFVCLLRRLKIVFPDDVVKHKWTEDDIQYVRDNIDVIPMSRIGEKFGVSMSAMSHFCKRHGIHKSTYFYKGNPYRKS